MAGSFKQLQQYKRTLAGVAADALRQIIIDDDDDHEDPTAALMHAHQLGLTAEQAQYVRDQFVAELEQRSRK